MRWSVFIAVLLTFCLSSPGDASAGKKNKGNRISVGPSGQFATIQEGVDAAQDGDQVLVEEGTYIESVVIAGKQNFVLAGARNNTIIIGTTSHAITLGHESEEHVQHHVVCRLGILGHGHLFRGFRWFKPLRWPQYNYWTVVGHVLRWRHFVVIRHDHRDGHENRAGCGECSHCALPLRVSEILTRSEAPRRWL